MPATEKISEALIRENIVRALGDVFKTMLARKIRLQAVGSDSEDSRWPPLPPPPPAAPPHVVGTVGFLGEINGLIYLYFDEGLAAENAGTLLGMTKEELAESGEDAVNDAIGEITNMVVGGFKNSFCDAGYPCKLTIPSILRGRNFCIEPISSAQRYIYHFECDGHRVVADILMKEED